MAYPLQNLNISWDFAVDSKSNYFNSPISISGDYCISFCDQLLPFYEICPLQNSQIYILEAVNEKPIFLNGATKPFVYIRNIGNYNINLCSAETGVNGLYFQYEKEKINNKNACSFSNYIIEPKQGLLLNLNVDQNGSAYFSSGEYPFGYFYNFSNLKVQNLCGTYPICCINGTPIYRYNDLSGFNVDYVDCGNNNFQIENFGTRRMYDAPNNSGNFLSLLINDNEYLSIPSGAINCECFDILNGNFNFQTWFKLNCVSTGSGISNAAYIDSSIPFSLLAFKCDRIIVGSGDSCFYDLCYNTCAIFFDGINNISAGIYTDNCSGAYLPSDNFTIEFFSKNDCLAGSSFFKFDGIELNLGGGYAPLILGNCHHNWNTGCYVKTGEWQHFAISKNNGCVRVYVDYCCVFGVCNTCCFTISNNPSNFIGCGLVGCIHSFRYLKNQSLYLT